GEDTAVGPSHLFRPHPAREPAQLRRGSGAGAAVPGAGPVVAAAVQPPDCARGQLRDRDRQSLSAAAPATRRLAHSRARLAEPLRRPRRNPSRRRAAVDEPFRLRLAAVPDGSRFQCRSLSPTFRQSDVLAGVTEYADCCARICAHRHRHRNAARLDHFAFADQVPPRARFRFGPVSRNPGCHRGTRRDAVLLVVTDRPLWHGGDLDHRLFLPPCQHNPACARGIPRWIATLRRVLIPLMLPALSAGFILLFIVGVREFTIPLVLYSQDNVVLSVLLWQLFQSGQPASSAALASVIIPVVLPGIFVAPRPVL